MNILSSVLLVIVWCRKNLGKNYYKIVASIIDEMDIENVGTIPRLSPKQKYNFHKYIITFARWIQSGNTYYRSFIAELMTASILISWSMKRLVPEGLNILTRKLLGAYHISVIACKNMYLLKEHDLINNFLNISINRTEYEFLFKWTSSVQFLYLIIFFIHNCNYFFIH